MLDFHIRKISSFVNLKAITYNSDIYSKNNTQKFREKSLLTETIKDATKNRTVMYELVDLNSHTLLGVIALSASRLAMKPALLIDYIFVIEKYRKKRFNDISCAEYLMAFAFQKAFEVQDEIGLSNLILYPDKKNQSLIEYYKLNYDFQELREKVVVQNKTEIERWLWLPLKK